MTKATVDESTQREIRWQLAYVGEDDRYLMGLFNQWWQKRKDTARYREKGIDHWKLTWRRTVDRVRRSREMFARGRCPECGAKLKTKRCLACDLRNGALQGGR